MTSKRRNGVGSRQLQDVIEKFRKGELKLIRALEDEALISPKESKTLTSSLERAVSQKRSSDLLEAAQRVNKKLVRVVQRNRLGEVERVDSELEVLYEISRAIQATTDRDKLFNRLLELVNDVVPYEHATLFVKSCATGRLSVGARRGAHVDLISGVEFDNGSGFSAWVAKQKRIIVMPDLHRGRRSDNLEVASFASVPLIVQGELIGVLNLSHSRPKAFQDEHTRILSLIASQSASVIQRVVMFDEMSRVAITDELTSLYNRSYILRRLREELERAKSHALPFSLLFIDIDQFKTLNDAHGRALGDKILRELAGMLGTWARSSDLVARYGGDEFVVLMPMTEVESAIEMGETLRRQVASHVFHRRKRLAVSIGAAGYPVAGDQPGLILSYADRALYASKSAGRGNAPTTVRSDLQAQAA